MFFILFPCWCFNGGPSVALYCELPRLPCSPLSSLPCVIERIVSRMQVLIVSIILMQKLDKNDFFFQAWVAKSPSFSAPKLACLRARGGIQKTKNRAIHEHNSFITIRNGHFAIIGAIEILYCIKFLFRNTQILFHLTTNHEEEE